jgi:hypothetical protein
LTINDPVGILKKIHEKEIQTTLPENEEDRDIFHAQKE